MAASVATWGDQKEAKHINLGDFFVTIFIIFFKFIVAVISESNLVGPPSVKRRINHHLRREMIAHTTFIFPEILNGGK